jgi:salicylate hydroxylase
MLISFSSCATLTHLSPYVAQGAAQAVEDAAALGVLLSTISSRYEIPHALKVYEQSRKQRAETVQQSGSENRITLHLPDGPEQLARDAQFLESARGSNPDKWSDRETQQFLWGWDAEKAALEAWNSMFPRPGAWCPKLIRIVSQDLVDDAKAKANL